MISMLRLEASGVCWYGWRFSRKKKVGNVRICNTLTGDPSAVEYRREGDKDYKVDTSHCQTRSRQHREEIETKIGLKPLS